MEIKSFEDYLNQKCFEENPQILDDDMPDFLNNWISNLDTDEVIYHAEEYGKMLRQEIKAKEAQSYEPFLQNDNNDLEL